MMLGRCAQVIARSRSVGEKRIVAQIPFVLSPRSGFFGAPQRNLSSKAPPGKAVTDDSEKGSYFSKVALGSLVIGGAVMVAYQNGYIGQHSKSGETSSQYDGNKVDNLEVADGHSIKQEVPSNDNEAVMIPRHVETVDKKVESSQFKDLGTSRENLSESSFSDASHAVRKDNLVYPSNENKPPPSSGQVIDSTTSLNDGVDKDSNVSSSGFLKEEKSTSTASIVQNEARNDEIEATKEVKIMVPNQNMSMDLLKEPPDTVSKSHDTHTNSYSIGEAKDISFSGKEGSADTAATDTINEEVLRGPSKASVEKSRSEDGKLIFDFIEAIHAAEKKQAESDAYVFSEEKRKLKEKYEKNLKDARARELMFAEEAAILNKELNKEMANTAATIKLLQEKSEQKLQEELQRKEDETNTKLKMVDELAKAELAAAIAKEKSSQIERIAEANLHINALCMAFYARSEEARQSHSVHRLALGTLALEDALSEGLPIRAEVNALRMSLEGIDRDSLLELALSSLPEESLDYGTDTQMQLRKKFESLKGTLRHFSLIPVGGGGLLAHTAARVASFIKIREDESGSSIESLISRVENFITEGRLVDAADALELAVRDTEAAGAICEWVRQARNRAVAEQVLSVLHSYATSITFT